MTKESEKDIVGGFEALMKKRGITDRKAYFAYLRDQKQKKYEASEARMIEAKEELDVLAKLLKGEL